MSEKVSNDYIIKLTEALYDLDGNSFDIDWHMWDQRKSCSIILQESSMNVKDDGRVVYNFNNEYFRSDDFINVHDGKHILFSGCSETEGMGGNIEEAWSKILYDKISKNEKCSGFFNIARSGWGYQRIINNCLTYFKKYGYPDTLFVLLPNSDRNFYYDQDDKCWRYLIRVPETYSNFQKNLDLTEEERKKHKRSTPTEYLENFVKFLYSWKLFCNFCNEKNIKLIFSTWDPQDNANFNKLNIFDNYFTLNIEKNIDDFLIEYYKNNEKHKNDISKRDGHRGIAVHHYWAQQFYEKYLNA